MEGPDKDADEIVADLLHLTPRTGTEKRSARSKAYASHAPSEDIRRMRPPSVFSLNGPLIHVFISYRVTSEQEMSDQLHEAIVRLSRDPCFAIPPGARGKRCQAAAVKCAPRECKVFLDRLCLLDGRDWEAGFVLSLAHSVVFVPLLSWGLDNTGSVGQMMSLEGDSDREDNVLLEFILALALKSYSQGSVQAIYPLLVGERRQDGSYADFPFAQLALLPTRPSVTNVRAAKIMNMLGLPPAVIEEMRDLSVRDIVYALLRSQGCKLSQLDVSSTWQDQCSAKILELLLREVKNLLEAPSSISRTRPGAEEMLQWLRESGLQPLSPVFIHAGLSNLQGLATISGQRLRELCVDFRARGSSGTVKLDEDTYTRFEVMRDKLVKTDLRARSINVRLNRFVDNKVSWAAAFSSTSAAEIAASSWRPQFMVLLLLLLHMALFAANITPSKTWQGKERQTVRWASAYAYPLIYLALIIGLTGYFLIGLAFARPLRAKSLLQKAVMFAAALSALSPVMEALQLVAGSHDASWTFGQYLWNSHYSLFVFQDLSWAVLYFALGLAMRRRQEWFSIILYCGLLWVTAERFIRYAAFRDLSMENLLFFVFFLAWGTVGLVIVYMRTRAAIIEAERAVSSHAATFRLIWEAERDMDRSDRALDTLAEETAEIEACLQQEADLALSRASSLSHGLWLRSALRLPQLGLAGSNGKFSVEGKVRQPSADIDTLFTRAAIINDTFQDCMEQLVSEINVRRGTLADSDEGEAEIVLLRGPVKAPERALQKCVRKYRRDVGCLTDLVRCTLIAKTPLQLLELFSAIRSMSVLQSGPSQEEGQRTAQEGVGGQGSSNSQGSLPELSVRAVRVAPEAAENELLRAESGLALDTEEDTKMFRMTTCKNRFCDGSKSLNQVTAFRNMMLNLEVGWVFQEGMCVMVPVARWEAEDADTLICEIQINLDALYYMRPPLVTNEGLAARPPGALNRARADYISYRDLTAR